MRGYPTVLGFNDTLIVAVVRHFESGAFTYVVVHGHHVFFLRKFTKGISEEYMCLCLHFI